METSWLGTKDIHRRVNYFIKLFYFTGKVVKTNFDETVFWPDISQCILNTSNDISNKCLANSGIKQAHIIVSNKK